MNDTPAEKLAVQGSRLDRLEKDVSDISGAVQELRDLMLQARGGYKTALGLAGAAGALAGLAAKLIPWGS